MAQPVDVMVLAGPFRFHNNCGTMLVVKQRSERMICEEEIHRCVKFGVRQETRIMAVLPRIGPKIGYQNNHKKDGLQLRLV